MREERPYWNTNVARHAGILRAAAPGMSYREVREAAGRVLPGVRYRWHVLRRYSLTWRKP
ncbi:hypothetical protein [Kitasatospora cathayae]|uniref:Uncharacterized protein n=1 Tax=Kitasatospora cathayae TaxID=3004092 RepID=A0ABY7QA31_9ACTN|nr:hypothetical protein [Kitasatospora sp. HUAS 3-15]WBP89610.1 hypothetical protein O1G21_29705 [Kitasatospora sp. HUAS 3-15]